MSDNYLLQFQRCFNEEQLKVLQSKRDEIFKLAGEIFYSYLGKVDLGLSEITIIAEDQGGWPFQALYMKMGTGHSTAQFYDMVISVLQIMKQ